MTKWTYLIAAAFICTAALTACSTANSAGAAPGQGNMAAQGESVYHKISAEEAKAMMDKGGVTVVDVRREDEYAAGHIPGSILVPNEGIRDTQPEELPDLDAVLLVHCRTGVRSKQASDKLLEIGYKNVYDLGGIVDWPYETVTED